MCKIPIMLFSVILHIRVPRSVHYLQHFIHWKNFFAVISDLSSGVFLPQPDGACQVLCKTRKQNSTQCCDAIAQCSCGTHTGHYACICPKGHYGQGLHGECTRKWYRVFKMKLAYFEYFLREISLGIKLSKFGWKQQEKIFICFSKLVWSKFFFFQFLKSTKIMSLAIL